MLIDNKAVVNTFKRVLDGTYVVPKYGFKRWSGIKELLETAGELQHTASWIPSHGKQADWAAQGPLTTEQCRKLNEIADAERARDHFQERASQFETDFIAAEHWSERALARLEHGMASHLREYDDFRPFVDKWLSVW